MRALIQRVNRAEVWVADWRAAAIGAGLLVLVGVGGDDREGDAAKLAEKLAGLRIFDDDRGRMNRSLAEIHGELLAVPQFTLYGDCRRGRRPDFTNAAPPELGRALFERLCEHLTRLGHSPQTGVFREQMRVCLENDGPVTIWYDTRDRKSLGISHG